MSEPITEEEVADSALLVALEVAAWDHDQRAITRAFGKILRRLDDLRRARGGGGT